MLSGERISILTREERYETIRVSNRIAVVFAEVEMAAKVFSWDVQKITRETDKLLTK